MRIAVYSVYYTAVATEMLNQLAIWGMNHLLHKFYLRYTICLFFFFFNVKALEIYPFSNIIIWCWVCVWDRERQKEKEERRG